LPSLKPIHVEEKRQVGEERGREGLYIQLSKLSIISFEYPSFFFLSPKPRGPLRVPQIKSPIQKKQREESRNKHFGFFSLSVLSALSSRTKK